MRPAVTVRAGAFRPVSRSPNVVENLVVAWQAFAVADASSTDEDVRSRTGSVVLWWIPVGAGGHVVRRTSGWWERVQAWMARRAPQPLYHAALEVRVEGERFDLEMAPAWGAATRVPDRGVVSTGPVGLRLLGRSRFFRYEVRCWRDGSIPDLAWAWRPPVVVSDDVEVARTIVARVRSVPVLTWGRTVGTTGDMWNSNSLVSWLLTTAGVDARDLRAPQRGRAPGWAAGMAVAGGPSLTGPAG